MSDTPLISVVVPIYKVEQYLSRCVDSIINQTYANLDIILVDDGSPDKCGVICDDYASKDSRIRVIHKENGGLSDARNAGMAIANGELITFIDSDDYVALNMIEHLLCLLNEHDADITICAYQPVSDATLSPDKLPPADSDGNTVVTMTGSEALEAFFTFKHYAPVSAWAKLYKTRLFTETGIRYPFGLINEDEYTTYKIFYHSAKVIYTDRTLYYYYLRDGSIMGVSYSEKHLDIIKAYKEQIEFVNSQNLPLTGQVQSRLISGTLQLIDSIIYQMKKNNRRQWYETLGELRTFIFKETSHPIRNRFINKTERMKLLFLKAGIRVYVPFKKIYTTLFSRG